MMNEKPRSWKLWDRTLSITPTEFHHLLTNFRKRKRLIFGNKRHVYMQYMFEVQTTHSLQLSLMILVLENIKPQFSSKYLIVYEPSYTVHLFPFWHKMSNSTQFFVLIPSCPSPVHRPCWLWVRSSLSFVKTYYKQKLGGAGQSWEWAVRPLTSKFNVRLPADGCQQLVYKTIGLTVFSVITLVPLDSCI